MVCLPNLYSFERPSCCEAKYHRPSFPLSLESLLDDSCFENHFSSPWADESSENFDYRHFLLVRALPRVMRCELTEPQYRCIVLHFSSGLSVREISERLGISSPSVSAHIKKGLGRLRRVLGYLFQE